MVFIVVWNNIHPRTRTPLLSPIFHILVGYGRQQIRGNARDPTEREQTAITIKEFRKYHGGLFFYKAWGWMHPVLTTVFILYRVSNIFNDQINIVLVLDGEKLISLIKRGITS